MVFWIRFFYFNFFFWIQHFLLPIDHRFTWQYTALAQDSVCVCVCVEQTKCKSIDGQVHMLITICIFAWFFFLSSWTFACFLVMMVCHNNNNKMLLGGQNTGLDWTAMEWNGQEKASIEVLWLSLKLKLVVVLFQTDTQTHTSFTMVHFKWIYQNKKWNGKWFFLLLAKLLLFSMVVVVVVFGASVIASMSHHVICIK